MLSAAGKAGPDRVAGGEGRAVGSAGYLHAESDGMTNPDAVVVAAQLLRSEAGASPLERVRAKAALFAEEMTLHHHPPLPADGLIKGAELARVSEGQAAALCKAVPDLANVKLTMTVEGSRVRVESTDQGTGPNGEPIELRGHMVLEVRGGRIVGMDAYWEEDGASRTLLTEVLARGGFDLPPEARAVYDGISTDM